MEELSIDERFPLLLDGMPLGSYPVRTASTSCKIVMIQLLFLWEHSHSNTSTRELKSPGAVTTSKRTTSHAMVN